MTTLAICKPRIRKSANIGDLVIAFASANLQPRDGTLWGRNDVVWAGVVSGKLPLGSYWYDPEFSTKKPGQGSHWPDNIYEPDGLELRQVPNPSHDLSQAARDKRGINALTFRRAWRFGPGEREMPAEMGFAMDPIHRRGERKSELSEEQFRRITRWLDGGGE